MSITLTTLGLMLDQLLKNVDLPFSKYKSIIGTPFDINDCSAYVKENDETYNREVVFTGDKCEVVVITWKSGQHAPIHNHATNGCFMKVIQGSLKEDIYDTKLNHISSSILLKNNPYFRTGDVLHSVTNLSPNTAVSVHVYSPPNFQTQYFE